MAAKIAGLLVGLWIVVAGAKATEACGFWHMTDHEKKLDINWLINSGAITSTKTKKRVGALYLDIESKDGIKVVTSKRVVFDVKDGKLRRYGKPVGSLAADAITIGKQSYMITFSDQKPLHDMPSWTVTVKRGDDVIVDSTDASALCAAMDRARTGKPMADEEQQDEIRRRVAYYLAWRQLGS
ncbi:MAG TPA: hypothetical protein VFQ53_21295 [Kofleriaceae bacterium]|nr:hypothetical protein [Kofleriaceae bacterium]